MLQPTDAPDWKFKPIAAADLGKWAKQWDALAGALAFPTVFNLHAFALSWWETHGEQCHSHFWELQDEQGQTRLIAPLAAWKHAPDDWFCLGHGVADYEALLVRAGDSQASDIFQNWIQKNRGWKRIELSHVEISQPTDWLPVVDRQRRRATNALRLLTGAYPLGYRLYEEQHPYFTNADFRKLSARTMSRDYRKHENWFTKRGTLRFETVRDRAEMEKNADTIFDLHVKKWSQKGGGSGLSSARDRAFLRGLMRNLGTTVRLDILFWNDTAVAAHFGFEWENRLYWYITTYDPDVASHSPGKLLLANVIRNAEADGLTEVDLLRGQEAYKFQYATHVRKTARVTFYRSRTAVLRRWIAQQWLFRSATAS
jgi:CelD/BcsL family acetyltransferase involved in cellulose biosynthesis